jgi:hypothetical protein
MGIHFQYSGELKEAKLLPELMFEVEDICDTLQWPVEFFETAYPGNSFFEQDEKPSFGIAFTPPECETIYFTFDNHGRLWHPFLSGMLNNESTHEIKVITVKLNLDDENPEPIITEGGKEADLEMLVYQIHVKTTTSDASAYIQIVELVRYISEKYLTNFTFSDDAGYWKNRNTDVLSNKLKTAKFLIETLHEKLAEKDFKNPEEFLKFIKQFSAVLKKNLKDNKE